MSSWPRWAGAIGAAGVVVAIVIGGLALADDPPERSVSKPAEIVVPRPDAVFDDMADPDATPQTEPTAGAARGTTPSGERTVRASGAGTVAVWFGPTRSDGTADYTARGMFFGDATGTFTEAGVEQYDPDRGFSTGTSSADLDIVMGGVGDGHLFVENWWWSDEDGHLRGEWKIVGGTDAFEGASGTATWSSTNGTDTISWSVELVLPG